MLLLLRGACQMPLQDLHIGHRLLGHLVAELLKVTGEFRALLAVLLDEIYEHVKVAE